ncbi:GAF domain-containing sensor histidine kinase [Virgibacillus kekensis]|uniref:histidine kinase n=1 Tax=Virgibacillus kekensis TaxID=202261 RepID=A0ABV9DJQ5_9BACI
MAYTKRIKTREYHAKFFMATVSILGLGLIISQMSNLQVPHSPIILILFTVFLGVSEYYPIPVWKGNTAINFPILFTLYLVSGLDYTVVIYAGVVLLVNLLSRRPIRILFFNPAQLTLSFFLAVKLADTVGLGFVASSPIMENFLEYSTVLLFFHLINNLLVDMVLWLRPQVYSFRSWKHKTLSELSSLLISLSYGFMLFLLGSQNREIDFFSFFFFFSPLVGLSLLSGVIFRLRKEESRLKALFSITSELNSMVPTDDWLDSLKPSFQTFIAVDASILWMKEGDSWIPRFEQGNVVSNSTLNKEKFFLLEGMREPAVYDNRQQDPGIASNSFEDGIKSFIYTPVIHKSEMFGVLVIGRSRTKSFTDDDVDSITSFANQLAIAMKTRTLIKEQEKRVVLEERNRIAREIHDGVAQSLAGAIMSLETAERKFAEKPAETLSIVSGSITKLRTSLKEIRESIYALKPYPTERIGLIPAISGKIGEINRNIGLEINFEVRGTEDQLSSMTEKILFDVFQESMANSIKHSKTKKVDVLLSYQSQQILLRVKDYGIGFSLYEEMIKAENTSHFGILNMNDSVEKVNGSLQIDSSRKSGTEVSVIIPRMGLEGGKKIDKSYAGR